MTRPAVRAAAFALTLLAAAPAAANTVGTEVSLALRDTFPIGSNGLCEAQILAPEPAAGLFDRRYSVICRDAAAPVGTLWVIKPKDREALAPARFAGADAACRDAEGAQVPGVAAARRLTCTRAQSVLRTDLLIADRAGRTYAAAGLSAYGRALELGLASLAADAVVPGTVEIPLTASTDALAFARQQAEVIAADQALAEAYRRSNAGNFAEAAEFFAASAGALAGRDRTEADLNSALQQSNLGNYAEAQRRFAATRTGSAASPVLGRLQRNYEAIDALNQRQPARALALLDAPLPSDFGDAGEVRALAIGAGIAEQLASESGRITDAFALSLTPFERATLLDGQWAYLKATALRQLGRTEEATGYLAAAEASFGKVRGGRVVSAAWLRAQVIGELAEVAERAGNPGEAERLHTSAIALLAATYPGSPALGSAQAQLAGLYARSGRRDEALALYRTIVSDAKGRAIPSLRGVMTPYFALLTDSTASGDAAAAGELFAASQLLQRPGLAQTQAALARELSEGSDEAAQLFRSAANLGRGIEQLRVALLDLETAPQASALPPAQIEERRNRLAQLQQQQAEVLEKLAAYPRYRAVTASAISLADLQAILAPGEAYAKLVTLERDAYVLYVTPTSARAWRADASPRQLESLVTDIRDSIAVVEGGQVLTYPFEIAKAREIYVRLFGPVAGELPQVKHLVFEPDGALLKLPINLLVTDDASIAAYQARLKAKADADEYDFTDTKWLGRGTQISTSVAASAFRDVRAARPSGGRRPYLGLGENAPIGPVTPGAARTRAVLAAGETCTWLPDIWASPIKARELNVAAARFGGGAEVVTGAAFTDSAIAAKGDLADFRILHFATHGLVTAPQPGCAPRPALLTSFAADPDSDGLLSFGEIFALRIDADLVILSACDTAGTATIGATRAAGVTSGGEFALDGLVRAFVGAGGRTVLASHWPIPDDFDATGRLVSGLFASDGRAVAKALKASQQALMDDPKTSHPFYWAAFAIVGDGAAHLAR
jgi:CHAT domain-containing protein